MIETHYPRKKLEKRDRTPGRGGSREQAQATAIQQWNSKTATYNSDVAARNNARAQLEQQQQQYETDVAYCNAHKPSPFDAAAPLA